MNMKWQQAGQKVKPGLKIAGKLEMLLAVALEPLLSRLANRFARGMK